MRYMGSKEIIADNILNVILNYNEFNKDIQTNRKVIRNLNLFN